MAVKYCERHLIGYNDAFDPTCPQCTLSHLEPARTHDTRELAVAAIAAKQNAPSAGPA